MLLVQSAFNSYEQYYILFAASPAITITTNTITTTATQIPGATSFLVSTVGTSSGGITFAAIVCGLVSILNGPPISTVAANGPFTFFGSRHESRQVPPHPYAKVKVWSYLLSWLLIRSFGADGLTPLQVKSIRSPSCPLRP